METGKTKKKETRERTPWIVCNYNIYSVHEMDV